MPTDNTQHNRNAALQRDREAREMAKTEPMYDGHYTKEQRAYYLAYALDGPPMSPMLLDLCRSLQVAEAELESMTDVCTCGGAQRIAELECSNRSLTSKLAEADFGYGGWNSIRGRLLDQIAELERKLKRAQVRIDMLTNPNLVDIAYPKWWIAGVSGKEWDSVRPSRVCSQRFKIRAKEVFEAGRAAVEAEIERRMEE